MREKEGGKEGGKEGDDRNPIVHGNCGRIIFLED